MEGEGGEGEGWRVVVLAGQARRLNGEGRSAVFQSTAVGERLPAAGEVPANH